MFENILGKKIATQSGVVISIDPLAENIFFCAVNDDMTELEADGVEYTPKAFDQMFYDELEKVILTKQEENPGVSMNKAAVILPDQLFLMDLINIPVIHRKAMQHSLSLAVEAIYNNAEDLNLMTYSVQQTKQAATFGIVGARRDLIENVRRAFSNKGIAVTGVTFASNAMVNGAMALNPKLKGDTFLLVDVKEKYTRFAFVVRGVTMGYYDVPFGYGILSTSRMFTDDMLFNHTSGELLVLNAKERARAKQLTMEGALSDEEREAILNGETVDEELLRRASRRRPKFMQRPMPETDTGVVYENFRNIIKWTLELINNNPNIVSLAKLEKVYVNIPREYRFVLERANKNKDQHGVTFLPLLADARNTEITANLELYGGFYMDQYNEANIF